MREFPIPNYQFPMKAKIFKCQNALHWERQPAGWRVAISFLDFNIRKFRILLGIRY